METVIYNYYQNIFATNSPDLVAISEVLSTLAPMVIDVMNDSLSRPCLKDKVRYALSQMHLCKVPGPNNMHGIFYQKFWHIIRDDVAHTIIGIVHGTCPLDSIDCTNVALIPKVKSPTLVSEFRPISLCNVIYKLVSKILANMLKGILPSIVSENQSAFVPDNALIALEIFHSMKHRFQG